MPSFCLLDDGRNRYIVECKVKLLKRFLRDSIVEIDTLWNVKLMSRKRKNLPIGSRNRYIVECKEHITTFISSAKQVEIDTLWNVKSHGGKGQGPRLRRNRYIVECKVKRLLYC